MLFFNSSTYANTDKQDEQSKLIDTFIELKNHEDKNVERYYLADGSLENKTISIIPERNIDFNPDNRQIRYYWKYQFNKNPKLSYDTVKYYYEIDCPHKN